MPRRTAGVLVIALIAAACSVEPIEDPGIGAGGLSSTVYAADGSVLTYFHAGEDRVLVTYDDLPTDLVNAVVAIEDQRFWLHGGIDAQAVARAVQTNYEAGEIIEGGSTITQQYVKNVLLSPEVSLDRKLEEAALAIALEETLTKEEILERYLNTVYFGNGAYGIAAAAKRYFDKTPAELTLAESATLAGMIQDPPFYDPYENPNAVLARRTTVLDKMVELGWLDQTSAAIAEGTDLVVQPRGNADLMRFPYFTEEARRRLLADPALGDTPEERFELLHHGGLHIYTTIDPAAQMAAEAAINSVLPDTGPAAALVAIDPRNGHVIALVGGRDYYDPLDPVAQFNLATMGLRQPGSSFKVFTLAAALEAGIGLDAQFVGGRAITIDTPTGKWRVMNYNNLKFPNLTLGEATVFSVNTVYAQVIDIVGPERVAEIASVSGISTPIDPLHSLALGTQEVTVLDMASAYSTFAAGGLHIEPAFVTRIEDAEGNVIYESVPTARRVLDSEIADQVTAALTEAVRRGTGQQAKIGRPVAGKTGTTEGHYDAWFVGYTPELVAAVWVGYPQGDHPLESPYTPYTITGGSWPAQIWARFASGTLSGVPYSELPDVDNDDLVPVDIDLSTGFLAGPLCPRSHVATIYVRPEEAPTALCPIHNPDGMPNLVPGTVPAVTELDLADAVSLLEAAGYEITAQWVGAADRVPGTVMVQYPAAGSDLATGSTVQLTVVGPEPGSTIPQVIGLPVEEAVRRLGRLGLASEIIVAAEPDEERAEERSGLVWLQTPAADIPADVGTVVLRVNP
jgi:1A family penicillin-binding protein